MAPRRIQELRSSRGTQQTTPAVIPPTVQLRSPRSPGFRKLQSENPAGCDPTERVFGYRLGPALPRSANRKRLGICAGAPVVVVWKCASVRNSLGLAAPPAGVGFEELGANARPVAAGLYAQLLAP